MSEIMSMALAQRTIQNYVCSRCWGRLEFHVLPGETPRPEAKTEVICRNPDCDGDGFVTEKYASRRKSESLFDQIEAAKNLGQALGLPQPKSKDLLKDLGF